MTNQPIVSDESVTKEQEELYELFSQLKTQTYANLLAEFKEDERFISAPWTKDWAGDIVPVEGDTALDQPTTPPTAYNAVENAADHLLTVPNTFVPVRPVTRNRAAAEDRAENQRRFHEMWWHRVQNEQNDPLGHGKKSLIKGKMVIKFNLKWDLLPELVDNPSKTQKSAYTKAIKQIAASKFLWTVEYLPKATVFEDPDGINSGAPRYVFEAYKARVNDVQPLFPGQTDLFDEKDALSSVEYVEYYSLPYKGDEGRHVIWIDNKVALDDINPFSWETSTSTKKDRDYTGFIPYFIGDPGWGDIGEDSKPEDRCVSIIRPIRSVIEAETRFLTSLEAFLRLYVWPILKAHGLSDEQIGALEVGPGKIWKLPSKDENIDIDTLTFGEIPLSLLQGMDRVNAYADETTKLGALSGTRQPGVDTATESDALISNAATKLSGPVKTLRRCATVINEWALQTIEHVIEAPVTVVGALDHGPAEVTIGPDDIRDYTYTQVELESTDQQMLSARKARIALETYSILPGYPERFAMEAAGVKNPREAQKVRKIEDILRSEPIAAVYVQKALKAIEGDQGDVGQAFRDSMFGLKAGPGGGGAAGQNGAESATTEVVEAAQRNRDVDQATNQRR